MNLDFMGQKQGASPDNTEKPPNVINHHKRPDRNNVPAEMRLHPAGGHGFVLKRPAREWLPSIFDRLQRGNLKSSPR